MLELLACPGCGGALAAGPASLACAACARAYPTLDGIPQLSGPLDGRTAAVREVYEETPFPGYPPRDTWSGLRARAERSALPRLLDRAIAPDATVVEVGCGTGQMSLFLATAERRVVAADLSRPALLEAAAAARRYGIQKVSFVETDLHAPGLRAGAFDVVYCSGVLHHTPDPAAAFRSVARLVRPGGVLVVGVYNAFARIPHRARRAVARLTGLRLVPGDPVLRDRAAEPARRAAWLRDQYRHPEEHRHTVREVQRWFEAAGLAYLRTYPSTVLGEEPDDLFAPAADDWALERVLQQIGWAFTLGREGGLFLGIGRSPAASTLHAPAGRRTRTTTRF